MDIQKPSIGEMMELMTDKELDHTKKALDSLRKEVEKNRTGIEIKKAMEPVKKSFLKDAEELKLSEEEANQKWEQIRLYIETSILAETTEWKGIDSFINNVEHLSGLKDVINEKDPIRKLKKIATDLGILTGLASALKNWADSMKGNKENDTFLGSIVRGWAAKLEKQDEAPTAVPPQPTTPETETEPEKDEAEGKLQEQEALFAKTFEKAGMNYLAGSLKDDYELMKTAKYFSGDVARVNEEVANELNADPIKKIADAYKAKFPGKSMEVRLAYLALNHKPEQTSAIVEAINGEGEYKVEGTEAAIHEFLEDMAYGLHGSDDRVNKYKPEPTAS